MTDPSQERRGNSESYPDAVAEVLEVGADLSSEGLVEGTLDGLSSAVDIAGDVVGGVLSILD